MQRSKDEIAYEVHLRERQARGEISGLQTQVAVPVTITIVRTLRHHVDFYYYDERLTEWVYDEFKGKEFDGKSKAIRDAWGKGDGPAERYRLTKRSRINESGFRHVQEIIPLPKTEALADRLEAET